MDKPILVRIMKDHRAPGSISHIANRGYAAAESSSSAARLWVGNITPGTMEYIQSAFVGNEDATLRSMLQNSKFSQPLVQRLVADSALSEGDMPRIWNTKTDGLTPEGKTLIQHMMAARIMNDFELPPIEGGAFANKSVTDVLNAAKPAQLERFESSAHLIDRIRRIASDRNMDDEFALAD